MLLEARALTPPSRGRIGRIDRRPNAFLRFGAETTPLVPDADYDTLKLFRRILFHRSLHGAPLCLPGTLFLSSTLSPMIRCSFFVSFCQEQAVGIGAGNRGDWGLLGRTQQRRGRLIGLKRQEDSKLFGLAEERGRQDPE